MAKLNFTKYPKINAIAREINSQQARLQKVRKVMNEIEQRKINFKLILQAAEAKIRDDFAKQTTIVKKKNIEDLKRARYFVTDLKRLEQNYKNKLAELNDACRYQISQRRSRQTTDIAKLDESYVICKKEEEIIIKNVADLHVQLKESWEFEKPKMKERKKEYVIRIKEASKKYRESCRRVKREAIIAQHDVIKNFKRSHPYYKFLRLRLFLVRWKNISKLDQNLYNLVVKVNELKLTETKMPRTEKNNLFNLKNEKRLNEGRNERATYQEFKNGFIKTTTKIMNMKYIVVLKGAFFSIMPIIFVTSFFTLLNGFFFSTGTYGFFSLFHLNPEQADVIKHFRNFGMIINNGIDEMFSIIIVAAIAWHMAKYYTHVDGFVVVFVTILCTVVMGGKLAALASGDELRTLASITNQGDKSEWIEIFGKSESFIALVVGLTCPQLFARLSFYPKLRIRLPDDTPSIIVRTFNTLLPMIFTLFIYGAISFTVYELGQIGDIPINYINDGMDNTQYVRIYDIQDAITIGVVKILGFSTNSLGNVILLMFFQQILWIFGIDPDPILRTITDPIFMKPIETLSSNVFSFETIKSFVEIGGGAAYLAIALGVVIFSKRRDYKIVAWIALLPLVFNITEPLAYGLPLTFNPIFAIPMVLVAILLPIYVFLCVHAQPALQATHDIFDSDLIKDSGKYIAFNGLPFFVMAGISANVGWAAVLFSLTCLILSVGIYTPFILLSNVAEKQEFIETMIREKQREQMINSQKIIQ